MRETLSKTLRDMLGDEDYLCLLENYAGTRLYVPSHIEQSGVAAVLGHAALEKISEIYAGDYLRVPLDREFRATVYRKNGKTNSQIAVRLGITENGVERIFSRLKPHKADRSFTVGKRRKKLERTGAL